MSFIKIKLKLLILLVTYTASSGASSFPVPEAKAEFEQLLAFPKGFSHNGRLTIKEYRAYAGPYAPLDIQITKARSYEDASVLKNLYLGISSKIVGFDRETALTIPSMVLCGSEECTLKHIKVIVDNQQLLINLAKNMANLKNVNIVAQWWQNGSYRVNKAFVTGLDVREVIPSELIGFVPSGKWVFYKNVHLLAVNNGFNIKGVLDLVKQLKIVGARAIIYSEFGGYDIIFDGVSDNYWGLLVLKENSDTPAEGLKNKDGFQYRVVRKISPGLYYYETG